MKKNRRKNQAGTSRPTPEPGIWRPAPARASRRWTLAAAVVGLVALVLAAIYFSTRLGPKASFPKGQSPASPPATPPAGEQSNRPGGLAVESAASGSNWDAINAGEQKNRADR